jgi:hypothetical protein
MKKNNWVGSDNVSPDNLLQKGLNFIVEAFDLKGKISHDKIKELEKLIIELKSKINILTEEMEMIKTENMYYKNQNEKLKKDITNFKNIKELENPYFDFEINQQQNKQNNMYISIVSDDDNNTSLNENENNINIIHKRNRNLNKSNFKIPPEKHDRINNYGSLSSRNSISPLRNLNDVSNNNFSDEKKSNTKKYLINQNEYKPIINMKNNTNLRKLLLQSSNISYNNYYNYQTYKTERRKTQENRFLSFQKTNTQFMNNTNE